MSEQTDNKKGLKIKQQIEKVTYRSGPYQKKEGTWHFFTIETTDKVIIQAQGETAFILEEKKDLFTKDTWFECKADLEFSEFYNKDIYAYHSKYYFMIKTSDGWIMLFEGIDKQPALNYAEQQILFAEPDIPKKEQKQDTKNALAVNEKETALTNDFIFNEKNLLPITIETVRKNICPKATDQELALFVQKCIMYKLNPFKREIYLIKYEGQAAFDHVAFLTFVKLADSIPEYKGLKAGLVIKDNEGKIVEREGCIHFDNETIVGAWGKVFRSDREPHYDAIPLSGYKINNKQWEKMPGVMIRKCIIAKTLREVFPKDLASLYISEEMDQAQPNS